MGKMKKTVSIVLALLSFSVLAACGNGYLTLAESSVSVSDEDQSLTSEATTTGRSYDSYDTAVITGFSDVNKTITFYNFEVGKSYTLSYDGATRFSDKYDTALSIDQLYEGLICDVCFMRMSKSLVSLQVSPSCFTESEISNFDVNTHTKTLYFKNDSYKISSKTVVISDGKKIDLADLDEGDEVTLRGMDNMVYSITVDKGHGYIRLEGEDFFIDGFLEVSSNLIYKIEPHMLVRAPEGEIVVSFSNKGTEARASVIVERNKETTLDMSSYAGKETTYGKVLFTVNPLTTILYVDGKSVDYSVPVTLPTGLHQLYATCDGYGNLTQYFRVGESSSELKVTLKSDKEDDSESSASDSTSNSDSKSDSGSSSGSDSGSGSSSGSGSDSNSVSDPTSDSDSGSNSGSTSSVEDISDYFIYIISPVGAETYFDGYYVGTSPVAIEKKSGVHVITFSMDGYITKSFTVTIDSELSDVTLSYEDLSPVG